MTLKYCFNHDIEHFIAEDLKKYICNKVDLLNAIEFSLEFVGNAEKINDVDFFHQSDIFNLANLENKKYLHFVLLIYIDIIVLPIIARNEHHKGM